MMGNAEGRAEERGERAGTLGLQGIAFSPPRHEINIDRRQASEAAPLMES